MPYVESDKRAVLSLRQLGAPHEWRVEAAPDTMWFRGPEGVAESLDGANLAKALNITHSIGAKPLMSVRLSRGKLVLQLGESDVRTLVRNVGQRIMTHAAVASHGIFDIILGSLIIISSLGPDDPLEPTGRSVKLLWMAIGALAVGIGIGAKVKPHRILLALDAVWMAALVANVIHDVAFGGFSIIWGLVVLILAPAAYGRLRMYQLLAPPRHEPPTAEKNPDGPTPSG